MSRKPEKNQSLTPIVALFPSVDSKSKKTRAKMGEKWKISDF
jgi:hypothetical protein